MNENLLAMAVAQSVDLPSWDDSTAIPKDDSAVLTTLLPLVVLLVVYGGVLLSSVCGGARESHGNETVVSTRMP